MGDGEDVASGPAWLQSRGSGGHDTRDGDITAGEETVLVTTFDLMYN